MSQGKRMRITTHCYNSIDKLHTQNDQLSICNAFTFLDAFALIYERRELEEVRAVVRGK